VLATAISLTDCNDLRLRALDIISQASADPVNQQVMLGIVQRLVDQLRAERRGAARILLLQSVANLAVSNSPAISGSVSVIIPLLDSRNDIERSVAVHAFTNLSMNIPPGQVTVFASAVPVCLKRLWKRGEVDGDMLRLLVNLACCPNLVPYMLANKSVTGLFAIMDCENNEILLRFITWLLCMTSAVEALSIGYERIAQLNHDPFGNPCYSLFHCLYGASGKAELLSKTQLLLEHDNMEIANKSRRLFELLQALNLGGKAGGSTLDQL